MAPDSNLPSVDVTLDLKGGEEARDRCVVDVCKALLSGWREAGIDDDSFKVACISGGITNILLSVTPPEASGLNPVAVRAFGDNTELLIDRERELKVLLQLNAAGFGAKVLGSFSNGRIEEFLHCKTLDPPDMGNPVLAARIAEVLARFHAVPIEGDQEPALFRTIHKWLAMAEALDFSDDAKKAAEFAKIDFGYMKAQVAEVQATCESMGSPVVFSHNDLLSGNILLLAMPNGEISETESPMQIIDFEYGSHSFRGFDWGNHFNEYAGFDCNWSLFPDDTQQRHFLKAYFTQGGKALSKAAMDGVVAEANAFALASHIYWGVWAIVQARYSPIDFDYLEYSAMRWAQYAKVKAGVMEMCARVGA